MIILVDNREQRPYRFKGYECATEPATLAAGDYSLAGFTDRVAIERKTLDDLVGCLSSGRSRFERELTRARRYELFTVVIEASLQDVTRHRYRSKMNPQSVIQSCVAFEVRYGIPFCWCGDRPTGELITFSLLSKYLREIEQRYNAAVRAQEEAAIPF